jgi:signal transduction histidine kinase
MLLYDLLFSNLHLDLYVLAWSQDNSLANRINHLIILFVYDLTAFNLKDMTTLGAVLRQMGIGATSMEEVANKTVRYLYENLGDETGKPTSALVRFFITYPYEKLDAELQQHVQHVLGMHPLDADLRCQTLLATVGHEADWNDRRHSAYYKALPLTEEIVNDNPMFAQVSDVFGIVMKAPVKPDPELLVELEQKTYNVFYVPDTVGNAYVPDQDDFVIRFGIRSLLGFYALLPSGNLVTVIVFSKTLIPRETTEFFRALALNVKISILPFDEVAVFDQSNADGLNTIPQKDVIHFRSQAASLAQLLMIRDRIVVQQSDRIEQVMTELREQAQELERANHELENTITENVRLRQLATEDAVIEERNRLSRELHDSVTQALYSQTLYAEAAARQLDAGMTEPAAEHVRQLRLTAQQALREMRLLIFELRPSALEREGFAAAVQARLESVETRTGLEAAVSIDEGVHLTPEMENDLYWIVQEALNNTLKSAQAKKVKVSLSREANQMVLQIADDGIGFDPGMSSTAGGLGLRSMHERAEKLGGKLQIESQPSAGTVVRVEVPCA